MKKKQFIKSNKGSIATETAIVLMVVFPTIYFIITVFSASYIYTAKLIDTTKNIADYIAYSEAAAKLGFGRELIAYAAPIL